MMAEHGTRGPSLGLGFLLVGCGAASLVGMAHHPEISGNAAAEVVATARQIARQSNLAHASLIALALLQWVAIVEVGRLPRISSGATRAAAALWGAGTATLVGAALISGFIAPDIGGLGASGELPVQMAADQLRVGYVVNQRLSQLGVMLLAASVFTYSTRLFRLPGPMRIVAGLGFATAVLGAGALASGHLQLDLRGMTASVAAISTWLSGLGVALIVKSE
jgi:4-hydroxybenzoate polyprenyltransferase